MLLVAAIWGLAFVFQRAAMLHVGPFTFSTVRFLFASLVLLPFLRLRGLLEKRDWQAGDSANVASPSGLSLTLAGIILGLLLFGGNTLQQVGLVYTTAGKAGFITSLYVVIVPFLLALVWRERISWNAWLGAVLAVVGLYLLSIQGGFRLALGDGLELMGAFVWALHVIAIGRLVRGRNPLHLALIQFLACALLSAIPAVALEQDTWRYLPLVWPALLYVGIMSTTIGFTVQVIAQQHAPPNHAAIIFSLESAFAALAGWLFLSEAMTARMVVGAVTMLVAVLIAQASLGQARFPGRRLPRWMGARRNL